MDNEEIMDAEYESINMVHEARKGKTVTTAIAVPIEQARRLLTAEADLQQLRLQVEQEEIARTMEHQRMEARKEINRVLQIGLSVVAIMAYLLGYLEGLINPYFAAALSAPWIVWSAACWIGRERHG